MIDQVLRQSLESARVARLQRQMAAIQARLERWKNTSGTFRERQRAKLRAKLRRLEFESKQSMLIPS
jgi:vacuolar-type H+-ATPase subunit I/STV1